VPWLPCHATQPWDVESGPWGGINELASRLCAGEAKEPGSSTRALVGSNLGNGFGLLSSSTAPRNLRTSGALSRRSPRRGAIGDPFRDVPQNDESARHRAMRLRHSTTPQGPAGSTKCHQIVFVFINAMFAGVEWAVVGLIQPPLLFRSDRAHGSLLRRIDYRTSPGGACSRRRCPDTSSLSQPIS
jgi:hypothetical protein